MFSSIKYFLRRSGLISEGKLDEDRLDDDTLPLEDAFRLHQLAFERRWRVNLSSEMCLSDFELMRTLGRGKFGRVVLARLRYSGRGSLAGLTTMIASNMSRTTDDYTETESSESSDSSDSDENQTLFYAVKVMRKRIVLSKSRITRVLFEKKILQCLVRFPFVVDYICHFKDNANLYLVLEFAIGGDMLTHLRRHRRFSDELTLFYSAQIVMALEFLHSLDIVHRDIKPQNMVIGEDGFVKLADFGLAKRLEKGCLTGTKCGTRVYMAPELMQFKRTPYSFNADWWSTGVMIYEMNVGRVPFEAANSAELLFKIMKGDLMYPPHMPLTLVELLNGLLEPNIKNRLVRAKHVKKQRYFYKYNWHALYTKQVIPPFMPAVKGPDDTTYFDPHNEMLIEEWDEDVYEEEFRDF